MPLYEYECQKCNHKFESIRNIADSKSILRCPRCGRETAYKVLSVFNTARGGSSAPKGGG